MRLVMWAPEGCRVMTCAVWPGVMGTARSHGCAAGTCLRGDALWGAQPGALPRRQPGDGVPRARMYPFVLGRSGVLASPRAHGGGASPQAWRRADVSASSGDRRDPIATVDGFDGLMVGCGPCTTIRTETTPVRGIILINGRLWDRSSLAATAMQFPRFTGPEIASRKNISFLTFHTNYGTVSASSQEVRC
jgi:hypothetical protein